MAADRKISCRIAVHLVSLDGGGAERVCVDLINRFVAEGVGVDLVLWRREGPYLSAVPEAVRLISLGAGGFYRRFRSLVAYLRDDSPQTLFCGMSLTNFVGVWAKLAAGSGTRVVLHETSTITQYWDAPRLYVRLMCLTGPWTYRAADHVVAVSQGVAADLRKYFRVPVEKLSVIHNPISVAKVRHAATLPPTHPWFGTDVPVVTGAGRLVPAKDFATLITAFASVRKQRRARLVIFGEGPERNSLINLASRLGVASDVDFPGFSETLLQNFAHASVFVLSSIREGFPNVLLEALACGAPVVATDCHSGPREILGDQADNLVPVADPEAMAAAILPQIDAGKINKPGSFRVEDYDIDIVARKYLDILLDRGKNF